LGLPACSGVCSESAPANQGPEKADWHLSHWAVPRRTSVCPLSVLANRQITKQAHTFRCIHKMNKKLQD